MAQMVGWRGASDIPAQVRSALAYQSVMGQADRDADYAKFEKLRDENGGDARRAAAIMWADAMIAGVNAKRQYRAEVQERRRMEMHHDPDAARERQVKKKAELDAAIMKRRAQDQARRKRGRYANAAGDGKLRRSREQMDRRNARERELRAQKRTNGEGW